MSVNAKIIIDEKEINVLQFSFGFSQGADYTGRPSVKPMFSRLEVVIETRKDVNLADWSFAPNQTKQLELHIYPVLMGGKTRKLYFYDCHLVDWKNNFSATGSDPMSETLTITSAGVKDSNSIVEYSAYWRKTYAEDNVVPTVINKEPETQIINIEWLNAETKEKIAETGYAETVSLAAQIENPQGTTAKITIEKEDGTEFESGKKQLLFDEEIAEDGSLELATLDIKEQWQDFKTSDIDKLVAKIDHSGYQKKSSVLEIVPPPKVIVDFRPSKRYDGEYGFDYMRDKKAKDDKLTYKDILGTNKNVSGSNVFTKYPTDTKYNDLKDKEYKTITFPWHKDSAGKEIEYLQSWLTIYPKDTQTLSLQIETLENPKKLDLAFEYDTTLFKLSTNTVPAQGNGKKRLKDHLTIECLKEFDTDQTIKVMYKKRQLGQLMVLKNNKANRKKAEVVFVKVTTELYKGAKLKGNTTNKTTGKPEKEMLERYLKQAYTKLELDEIAFDLTIPDPTTTKPKYPDFNKDYTLLNSGVKILNKYSNTSGGDSLAEYMEKTINTELPKYKDYFKIFFFGDSGGRKESDGSIVGLAGYAKGFNTQSAIMFADKRKATVTHELLHCIGLKHSFSNSTYNYKKEATENIMDYSTTRKHTWLWQWKQLWENKDLKNE